MKHKKIKIAALVIVTASLLGVILYSEFGTKKSYDYSEYYVESKPGKAIKENKDNEEASEKEYIKLDRDKSTFKSHRDFSSEIEITFKHF